MELLREKVRDAMLAGKETLGEICTYLVLAKDAPERNEIASLLRDGLFLREVDSDRLVVEQITVNWFKKRALSYAKKMDALTDAEDPRVRFQATKDALDRIGTKPENRVAVSGLDQYKALIQELMPEKKEK
jgi:hypothetical protein